MTTQSGPAAASASAHGARQRAHRRGDERGRRRPRAPRPASAHARRRSRRARAPRRAPRAPGRSRGPRRRAARARRARSTRRSGRRRGPRRSSVGRARERLAGDRGRPLDLLDVVGEAVGVRAPAGRRRSPPRARGCTSTMIPSAPAAAAASDSGVTSRAGPAAWLGSTITGRCVSSLSTGHGGQVEREAVGGLERADAALAQQHVRVALLEDVLRRHQQLLERRRQRRA